MRIIAGAARGRRLAVPPSGVRPTTDRVRESLFSTLTSIIDDWADLAVLDLFAGSGSLGLEALSRGARSVCLVERDRRTAEILERNIAAVGLPGATLLRRDAAHLAASALVEEAGLVFADPPYDVPAPDVASLLSALRGAGWIRHDALVVVERPSRDRRSPWPDGWAEVRCREYGETALWYGRPLSEPIADAP